jgi:hypothetical protein
MIGSFPTCCKLSRFVILSLSRVARSTCRSQAELVLDVRFALLAEGLRVRIPPTSIINDSQFMS